MNKYKYQYILRTLLMSLFGIILACTIFTYAIFDSKKANAMSALPTSPTVGELYNFNDYCYNKDALDKLSQNVLSVLKGSSQTSATFDNLVNYAKNTAFPAGKPIAGNNIITVSYGRYRFTTSVNTSYKPLIWMPVYISQSKSGDAILTLYLAATGTTNGSTSNQEVSNFAFDKRYSSNLNHPVPSNMYSTSYMRAVALGNNGNYYAYRSTGDTTTGGMMTFAQVVESTCNKFNDFIKYYKQEDATRYPGLTGRATGLLYDDLATPEEMSWQENESAPKIFTDAQGNRIAPYGSYYWPNEAYGAPSMVTGMDYYKSSIFDYSKRNIANYDLWKSDKVWLPSLTEVGTGDIYFENESTTPKDTTNGIWKLTKEKRANTIASWLRTANPTAKKVGDSSIFTMFGLDKNGAVTDLDLDATAGVRPAIHLNLSKLQDGNKFVPPVNLPDTVKSIYCGKFQDMSTVPADNKKWYDEADMSVSFSTTPDGINTTWPLNSGTYYMKVTLNAASNKVFRGENLGVREKIVKFVVEKAKLNVRWVYENASELAPPKSVEIDGEFFQRDIDANNVPKIGMLYSNVTNSGIVNSLEFPDKIGYYKAKACILDDDTHQYNYELVDDVANNKPLTSHQFYVDKTEIPIPRFLGKAVGENLSLNYQGRQFVQIENVNPKYVEITCQILAAGLNADEIKANSEAAKKKMVDKGVVDGVLTYEVTSVATYTFTIKLKDPDNTVWAGTKDFSNKSIKLAIERARITLAFDGLPSSWGEASEVAFSVKAVGVYDPSEEKNIVFNVAYYEAKGYVAKPIAKDETTGKYVIKGRTLKIGEYYIYAVLAGNSSYNNNYTMEKPATQKFMVTQTKSEFTAASVKWQYRIKDQKPAESYAYDTHDSESKALELPYVDGGYYQFYLSLTEDVLKGSPYFVRAEYSGDKSVTNAGMHSLTVTIKPYDKNISFEQQSYTIFFKIDAKKYDLSGVQWDYSDTTPFTYSGNVNYVNIKKDTIPAGLSVVYRTGTMETNGMTDAGVYTTIATFKVSEEYAKNYVAPDASNPDSFVNTGTFKFSQQWEIKKLNITASWISDNASGDLFFIPHLKEGHKLVNYTFEENKGGSFTPCTTITASDTAKKYRVTAKLTTAASKNFTLTGTTNQEFEIAANQFAVAMFVEINGVKSDHGSKFPYTGTAYAAVPKVGTGTVSISNYTVDYYNGVDGTRGSKVTGTPTAAGSYIAVIKANFSHSGGTPFANEIEFEYSIEKANLNLSTLMWQHVNPKDNKTIIAKYDSAQGKFIDANGAEAVFAFPYDGTQQTITLSGVNTVPGLQIKGVNGNTGSDARKYTAYITWQFDDKNYNEPEFPKSFAWEITQAQIDFSKVEWGYIDANGVEHKFDKDGAIFNYTRDKDKKSVNYTIALINIPTYLKQMFSYKTSSYTDKDFGKDTAGKVDGNSFSAAGEYRTEVTIAGTYTDPSGNVKPFSAAEFPLNIAKSVDWEIKDRVLTMPKYNGSWTTFDNKTHNIIELCGIPKEELNYFHVETVFVNFNNVIDNDYGGYNDQQYQAFEAGTYIVRFGKLDNADGSKWFIWGQVEFDIKKSELEITWDKESKLPVAKVKGVYVTDKIETKYYFPILDATTGKPIVEADGKYKLGAEVTEAYIKTTNLKDYIAKPSITTAYSNNMNFKMTGNEPEEYCFNYEQFIVKSDTVVVYKPKIKEDKFEWTGNDIIFRIEDWDTMYDPYLYIIEGIEGLTQREKGVYHVSIRFKKEANAYWGESSAEDPDRSTVVLTFEVLPPSKMPIEYPTFDKKMIMYEGDDVTFTITNFVAIQEYLEYEVFNKDISMGKNIPLTFSEIGIYKVVFTFPEGSIGNWKQDKDNPKKAYTVELQVRDGSSTELLQPEIPVSSQPYTSNEISFELSNYDSMNFDVKLPLPLGVTFDGASFKAKEVGTYNVTIVVKTEGLTFVGGAKECKLTFKVTPSDDPNLIGAIPKPTLEKATAVYTGSDIECKIKDWFTMNYDKVLAISVKKDGADAGVIDGGTIKVKEVGKYVITLTFLDTAPNAKWQDKQTRDPLVLEFTVTDKPSGGVTEFPTPVVKGKENGGKLEFTGKDKDLADILTNWGDIKDFADKIEIKDESGNVVKAPKAVGTYTVTVKLNPKKAIFDDGLTEKNITFTINPAELKPENDPATGEPLIENNMPVYTNGDGDRVDIKGYFNPTYTDPTTGEVVEKPEKDKEYKVTYAINEERRDELSKSVSNSSIFTESVTTRDFTFKYVPEQRAFDWLLILIIGGSAFLVLVLIIIIIVFARRRANAYYDDGYGGGYSDGGYGYGDGGYGYDDGGYGYDDGGYDDGGYDDYDDGEDY